MKSKLVLCFLTLMLCMGVFTVTAFAASDTEPPTLTAWITGGGEPPLAISATGGEVLHIEVSDVGSGVEAVFIDERRVNYRVDSALDLDYKDYVGDNEYISIYAMDFAGNKSNVVQVKNPLKATQSAVPTAPTELKPFTPDGTGTVMDNATDGDGKEFFTITTPDENVFYLIIDRQRNADNVYLLSAVTEDDLKALAKKDSKGESVVPAPEVKPTPKPESEPQPKPKQSNNTGTVIFVLLAAAAVGGAGYYFKIYKPKQQISDTDEEYEDDEDMEFEDETTEDETSDDGAYSNDFDTDVTDKEE